MVEDSHVVAAAAHRYGQGGPGLSDLMILSAAGRTDAAPLHTFYRRLAQMPEAVLAEHTTGYATMKRSSKEPDQDNLNRSPESAYLSGLRWRSSSLE